MGQMLIWISFPVYVWENMADVEMRLGSGPEVIIERPIYWVVADQEIRLRICLRLYKETLRLSP